MSVFWSRHEHVVARRVLTNCKTVSADGPMRQVSDPLEDLSSSNLEQGCGRAWVYPSRHLRDDPQFRCLQGENVKFDPSDVLDEFVSCSVIFPNFGAHDFLQPIEIPGRTTDPRHAG